MTEPRYDWTIDEVLAVIERPFHDLLAAAHACHRERFDPHEIEDAKLLSIKTGACPEDCAYCPQSARNETDRQPGPLMDLPDILAKAGEAKAEGATRFCMGAAWRSPNDRQVDEVAEAVHAVADLGMETCVTLGMLTDRQAKTLADA